jgi:hypothetical protein
MSQKILITGSGRCGTYSMANFLDGMTFKSGERVVAQHETQRNFFLEMLKKKEWGSIEIFFLKLKNQIEISPYISLLPKKPIKDGLLIALIRDGRDTVRSGMNSGWFLDISSPETSWKEYLPEFKGDRFEKCCQLWAWVYKKLEGWDSKFFRTEDLASSEDIRNDLFAILNITQNYKSFLISNIAVSRKKRVFSLENKELPKWEYWTPNQRLIFIKHCGKLMKKYYKNVNLN